MYRSSKAYSWVGWVYEREAGRKAVQRVDSRVRERELPLSARQQYMLDLDHGAEDRRDEACLDRSDHPAEQVRPREPTRVGEAPS